MDAVRGLSRGIAPTEWKRVVINGKSGLEASEFMPLSVSSVISGWESRNRARGGLQCMEVVRERSLKVWVGVATGEEGKGVVGCDAIGSTHVGECRLGSSITNVVRLTIFCNTLSNNK